MKPSMIMTDMAPFLVERRRSFWYQCREIVLNALPDFLRKWRRLPTVFQSCGFTLQCFRENVVEPLPILRSGGASVYHGQLYRQHAGRFHRGP
jgi:hypothetical protein